MDITVNSKGNLEIDIKDLLQHIPDEEADELISALAWDSRLWNSLKDAIKNYTFEKIASGAPDEGSAGGEDDRPGEL